MRAAAFLILIFGSKLIRRKTEPTHDKQTATNGARHQGRFLAAHENATFVLLLFCFRTVASGFLCEGFRY